MKASGFRLFIAVVCLFCLLISSAAPAFALSLTDTTKTADATTGSSPSDKKDAAEKEKTAQTGENAEEETAPQEPAGLGDADADGQITPADARIVLRISVQIEEPKETAGDMDVDEDGTITSSDARLVLRRAVSLDLFFPSEAPYKPPKTGELLDVEIDAPFALLYNAEENRLLFWHNTEGRTAPASLLKLLSALTALKHCSPETVFTVGDEIDLIEEDSSVCPLEKGWELTLEQLLYGMMLCSGNDAAYCVAANVAKKIKAFDSEAEAVAYFVSLMNQTARELGMAATRALSPDGYDTPGQHTTPSDLLTLARAALENELLADICAHYSYTFTLPDEDETEITWTSTNRFLNPDDRFYDEHVHGLKGGFTDDAGCCLISSWQVQKKNYIVIIMGLDSFNARYSLSTELMNAVAPDKITVKPENPPEE